MAGSGESSIAVSVVVPFAKCAEQDIYNILKTEYHKDLIHLIKSETSGNYQHALISYVENCLRP